MWVKVWRHERPWHGRDSQWLRGWIATCGSRLVAEDTARLRPREPLEHCRERAFATGHGALWDSEGGAAIKRPILVAACCGAVHRSRRRDQLGGVE